MTKITKVSDKLVKSADSFVVNMYDNGFMLEVGGRNKKDDWATAKIMVTTLDELNAVIKEVAMMERES